MQGTSDKGSHKLDGTIKKLGTKPTKSAETDIIEQKEN